MTSVVARSAPRREAVSALLRDISYEVLPFNNTEEAVLAHVPTDVRITVTTTAAKGPEPTLSLAEKLARQGYRAAPHIAARQVRDEHHLRDIVARLEDAGVCGVFVIGGDAPEPAGTFTDAVGLLESLETMGHHFIRIGIGGYPEGHPAIPESALWSALEGKAATLSQLGLPGVVITQFGFDVDPVLKWLEAVRERGIDLPVRVGVPGPAGVRRLLSFAARMGVGTSAGIAKKYGFSITNLMGSAGPDRFIRALAEGLDPERHGEVKLHFYTFGGLKATSEWIAEFRRGG